MVRYLIFLVLMMVTFLFLLGCPSNPPEPPDFGTAYAGWVHISISSFSSQDVSIKYHLFIVDINKSNTYIASSINDVIRANEKKWIVWDALGLNASYHGSYPGILLRDEPVQGVDAPNTNVRRILFNNNITNLIISFLIEVTKGGSKITFTGFDESITNITNLNANVYGLGYFDGVFDCGDTITNILRVVPLASYTDTYYEEFLYCHIDVTDSEVKATFSVVYYGEITTNISF